MSRRRNPKTPRQGAVRSDATTGPSGDLLEQCQRAVSRVLAELPAQDRQALVPHETRVVEMTFWETRAALAEIQGVLDRVA